MDNILHHPNFLVSVQSEPIGYETPRRFLDHDEKRVFLHCGVLDG
jgi:hypothetical protein